MKLARFAFRSINNIKPNPFHCSSIFTRSLSADAVRGHENGFNQHNNNVEPDDDYERLVGNYSDSSRLDKFMNKIPSGGRDRLGGYNASYDDDSDSEDYDSEDYDSEDYDSEDDEMDDKLRSASCYFEFDPDEVEEDGYTFRPDSNFPVGSTYSIKDLDLRKPAASKTYKRPEFKVTTEEVLEKADFRNVRFLANFITEAGIIIKRSQTGISAKAQRKVAREIKTARAFGLMPFTCMGTKSFVYGRSMENREEDFEYVVHDKPRNPSGDGYDDTVLD